MSRSGYEVENGLFWDEGDYKKKPAVTTAKPAVTTAPAASGQKLIEPLVRRKKSSDDPHPRTQSGLIGGGLLFLIAIVVLVALPVVLPTLVFMSIICGAIALGAILGVVLYQVLDHFYDFENKRGAVAASNPVVNGVTPGFDPAQIQRSVGAQPQPNKDGVNTTLEGAPLAVALAVGLTFPAAPLYPSVEGDNREPPSSLRPS